MAFQAVLFSQSWQTGTGILYANPITTKVGIGTLAPAYPLDVTGNVLLNGNVGIGLSSVSSTFKLAVAGPTLTNGLYIGSTTEPTAFLIALNKTSTESYLDMPLDRPFYIKFRTQQFSASAITILANGNVGIGCTTPSVLLAVNGKIQANEIEIKAAPCSDYVFDSEYNLKSLDEVEQYIKTNKHLPEVPSAKEFSENGYSVNQMDDLLLRKVEELTLYIIEQNKRIEAVENENAELKSQIEQ